MFFLYYQFKNKIDPKRLESCQSISKKISQLSYSEEVQNQVIEDNFFFVSSKDCYSRFENSNTHFDFLHGDMWHNSEAVPLAKASELSKNCRGQSQAPWRGNFAHFSINKISNELLLSNDPLGLQPIFFSHSPNELVASSLPNHILDFLPVKPEINWNVLLEHICFGAAFPGSHLFKDINKMHPSSQIHFINGDFNQSSYSHTLSTTPFVGSLHEASELAFEKLTDATQRLVDHHNVQHSYLTGGSDSRILLSAMREDQRKRLKYICYTNAEWSTGTEDSEIAELLANHWGLDLELTPEPIKKFNFSKPDLYRATNFNMIPNPTLTGSFGTETVGGAPFHSFGLDFTLLEKRDFLKNIKKLLGPSIENQASDCYDHLISTVNSQPGGSKEYNFFIKWLWQSELTAVYSGYNSGAFIFSYANLIKKKISPFMDDAFLEVMMSFPREYLMKYAIYGELFSGRLKEIAKIPFNSNFLKNHPQFPKLRPKLEVGVPSSFDHRRFVIEYINDSFFKDSPFSDDDIVGYLKDDCPKEYAVRIADLIVWHSHLFSDNPFKVEQFKEFSYTN